MYRQFHVFTEADRLNFLHLCRGLALGATEENAESLNVPDNVVPMVKAAVSSMTTGDTDLAPLTQALASFVGTLSNHGVFDALLSDMQQGQLYTRFGVLSSYAVATETGEALGKGVSKMNFAPANLQPLKATALVVMSKDLLRFGRGINTLETGLTQGVVAGTDSIFLAAASAAAVAPTSITYAGPLPTSAEVLADLRLMLDALTPGSESRLAFVFKPAVARRLSCMADVTGARVFPGMNHNGGEVVGVRAFASDQTPDDAQLIDAAAYVADGERVQLRRSEEGAVLMDSNALAAMASNDGGSPGAPVPAQLVSLWQTNSVAVLAERFFGFTAVRTPAVKRSTVEWGKVEQVPDASPFVAV